MEKIQEMKKSVGIITFHASHNYGSMLQAYALQQVILKMGFDCEIINFRTKKQKDFYKPMFLCGNWLQRIKRTLFYLSFIKDLKKKHQLFEDFLLHELVLSDKEYATLEELKKADLKYDYYLSGSDQIWNTSCLDFDWAYFLPFVKQGRKIAYAPSLGPVPLQKYTVEQQKLVNELLGQYDSVSVREQEAAMRLKEIAGKEYPVTMDPTLLLTSQDWERKINDKPLIKGRYIFFYAPWYDEKVLSLVNSMAEYWKMPVVFSQFYYGLKNRKWITNKNFYFYLPAGPYEFLNLCKYATCIIGTSFHLVVFSILLRVPFYTVNGLSDSRISNLLNLTGLQSQSIELSNSMIDIPINLDFDKADKYIREERLASLNWLQQSFLS